MDKELGKKLDHIIGLMEVLVAQKHPNASGIPKPKPKVRHYAGLEVEVPNTPDE